MRAQDYLGDRLETAGNGWKSAGTGRESGGRFAPSRERRGRFAPSGEQFADHRGPSKGQNIVQMSDLGSGAAGDLRYDSGKFQGHNGTKWIGLGVDENLFSPDPSSSRENIFLSIGRIQKQKRRDNERKRSRTGQKQRKGQIRRKY